MPEAEEGALNASNIEKLGAAEAGATDGKDGREGREEVGARAGAGMGGATVAVTAKGLVEVTLFVGNSLREAIPPNSNDAAPEGGARALDNTLLLTVAGIKLPISPPILFMLFLKSKFEALGTDT